MNDHVLVVDDEEVFRRNLVRALTRAGHPATGFASAEAALDHLAIEEAAVLLTDLRMPGMGGEALLEHVAREHPDTAVVVMTAFATVDSAVAALRLGAWDYLLKPVTLGEVVRKVERILAHQHLRDRVHRLRQELRERSGLEDIVARSPAMKRVLELVDRAAAASTSVLLQGESGTGKELLARALHDRSPRAEEDFLPVNLAALPRDLVDATLFGHVRGAYTGADRAREGVFAAARGGTVFLDEIGELPEEVQVKLLRVLENREVLPLGADRPRPVDFRLVAATNRSLQQAVQSGRFRADLYYRLAVFTIEVPPLRERPEDIPPLAHRLLARHAEAMGRPLPALAPAALDRLRARAWRGNVRELSNVLERALLLCDGDTILPEHLGEPDPAGEPAVPDNLKEAREAFERRHIARVLARHGGDKVRAARALGIHLATLYRHLERLGLRPADTES